MTDFIISHPVEVTDPRPRTRVQTCTSILTRARKRTQSRAGARTLARNKRAPVPCKTSMCALPCAANACSLPAHGRASAAATQWHHRDGVDAHPFHVPVLPPVTRRTSARPVHRSGGCRTQTASPFLHRRGRRRHCSRSGRRRRESGGLDGAEKGAAGGRREGEQGHVVVLEEGQHLRHHSYTRTHLPRTHAYLTRTQGVTHRLRHACTGKGQSGCSLRFDACMLMEEKEGGRGVRAGGAAQNINKCF